METYLAFAQGPLLRFCLALFVLGLLRHLGLFAWYRLEPRLLGRAPTHRRRLLPPLVPGDAGIVARAVQLALVAVTLVAVLAITVLYHTHMALFQVHVGFEWPVLPHRITDQLTFLALATAVALFVWKWTVPEYRQPVRLRHFFWAPVIGFSLVFGYLTAHPEHSPLPYDVTRLIHVLGADLLLALAPFAFVGSWAEVSAAVAGPVAVRSEEGGPR